MDLDRRVTITTTRCFECHRWWAYEDFGAGNRGCPYCLNLSLTLALRSRLTLERQLAAMRGVVTKLKRERK